MQDRDKGYILMIQQKDSVHKSYTPSLQLGWMDKLKGENLGGNNSRSETQKNSYKSPFHFFYFSVLLNFYLAPSVVFMPL